MNEGFYIYAPLIKRWYSHGRNWTMDFSTAQRFNSYKEAAQVIEDGKIKEVYITKVSRECCL